MRTVSRALMLAVLLTATVHTGSAYATTPAGSVTVAPAAIRLELTKGQQNATASFTVTNSYASDISLHFSLEAPVHTANSAPAVRQLALANESMTIAGGGKAQQTITLNDTVDIEPGSQSVDLVITQRNSAAAAGVGVVPGVRLPVTIIKQDGAVTSLGFASIARPGVAMSMPRTTTITLRNTGNMIAIPRGTVTIETAGGKIIGKGTLNEASKAIAPGAALAFSTPITSLANAVVPGNYRIAVHYGLGGNNAIQTEASSFFYIAWWHGAGLLAAAGVGWLLYTRAGVLSFKHKTHSHSKTKRQLLIGRDIT